MGITKKWHDIIFGEWSSRHVSSPASISHARTVTGYCSVSAYFCSNLAFLFFKAFLVIIHSFNRKNGSVNARAKIKIKNRLALAKYPIASKAYCLNLLKASDLLERFIIIFDPQLYRHWPSRIGSLTWIGFVLRAFFVCHSPL